jgi:4-amino-4-deoxy-L-arabinose transferase-like glycosyltransferase
VPPATAPTRRERSTYLGLAAFAAVLWLATLSLRPLFNTDEGRYAEIPREMLSGGDWVIPHLNGLAYVEKPPLQYWATALSLRVVGQSEFGARLYTALCALAAVLIVALTANRLWGAAAGWRAGALLASMLLFLVMGQLLTLDMSLTWYMTLALVGFLRAQQRAQLHAQRVGRSAAREGCGSQPGRAEPGAATPGTQRERGWMLLAWVATALGVLTKGLVAAALPAAVLVLYSLYARDWQPWRRLHASIGLPLFLAIAIPWYWLAARRLPDFLQFFFVHEHLARYLTPSADREEAWWFFGAVFLVGSVPWTLQALRALFQGWRRPSPGAGFNAKLFLRIWVLFVCLFFSVSSSKLIPYILPAFPALALLTADLPADVFERDLARTALLTLGCAIALGATCLFAPRYVAPSDRSAYFLALANPLAQIALLLAASALYVMSQRRRDLTRATVFLGAGWCLSGLLMMRAAAAVAPVYSGVTLARALPGVPRDIPLYSVATYDQTLPFYWQRTVELVAYRGELDYGLRYDPQTELPSLEEFTARWSAASSAYAVMEKKTFRELATQGVPMRELARDANRVLVARR